MLNKAGRTGRSAGREGPFSLSFQTCSAFSIQNSAFPQVCRYRPPGLTLAHNRPIIWPMAEQDALAGAGSKAPESPLMSVRQAIEVIDSTPVTPNLEPLPLAAARGYRLARDVTADRDYPPFDKSVMDGYAVRAADLRGAGTGRAAP